MRLTLTVPRDVAEEMARKAHRDNFAECEKAGREYADPSEMEMHESDPCACWDLVRTQVESALGNFAFDWADSNSFYFYAIDSEGFRIEEQEESN